MERQPASEMSLPLQGWRNGDRKALHALLSLVYTLQSAALVHEAYLRLIGLNPPEWESRTHFFAIAAQLMRQILVDYARRRSAAEEPYAEMNQLLQG